ncbi:hypothetical protein EVAR_57044_1 [Eumeta japonica]|uniref:Uncharacterized protein n=1 Tax=Eumeta variegata TaxID=151549 RepID=A0A4C1YSN6_EUMVA|nr:hypothetical protein EVAR_57044_1 [Eumeta japonica]
MEKIGKGCTLNNEGHKGRRLVDAAQKKTEKEIFRIKSEEGGLLIRAVYSDGTERTSCASRRPSALPPGPPQPASEAFEELRRRRKMG